MASFQSSVSRLFIVLGVALLLFTFSLSSSSDDAHAQTGINIGDQWFCLPSFQFGVCETNITVGTEVTWTWVGAQLHNTVGSGWASSIKTSGTFAHTFNTEGEFTYLCTVHPLTMNGKITVTGVAVGGIAELPGSSTSQVAADAGRDRSIILIGAGLATTLVIVSVASATWLTLRRRA
jgi:plastocyanin